MAQFRLHRKDKGFTTLDNEFLHRTDMTLKAKGLLAYMLSLPKDWNYSIAGLCTCCKENETAISSGLKELQDLGYLVVTKLSPAQTESGHFEYVYDVYEVACDTSKKYATGNSFLNTENLPVEELPVEDQPLYKTNNNKTNTRISSKDDILDRATPSTPKTPRRNSGKLFDTPKATKKSSVQKTNAFITMCERVSAKFNFSQELLKELGNYFRMLGSSGSLLPEQSIEEQMKILADVRERDRVGVVKDTVGHGWKSLQYSAKECKEGSTPSWDTARPDAFRAKTMEEKRRNPLEGVPEEDIF